METTIPCKQRRSTPCGETEEEFGELMSRTASMVSLSMMKNTGTEKMFFVIFWLAFEGMEGRIERDGELIPLIR